MEQENQPKRRIKTMAQKSIPKPKPNYDRKAKHPDYVQFRCNASAFNNIIRDVKDKLNERQKKLLKKTPFWNLIELFYHQRIDMNNMNKSDLDLAQLLKTFDPDTKSFKFGTKSFQITGNAVTQILGLPNEGKSVKLVNDRYTSTFRTRHFGEKGKPSKNQVEAELQKIIALANQPKKEKAKTEQKKKMNKGKEKKEAEEEEEEEEVDYDKEVVSLILILLCITFLFANSSSTLHWKLFEHCVNLDTLSSYSWARAVSAYMNESLTTKAIAKAKKGGEASIGAVSGCTILILFLLCERTNIIQPILGKEKETPAILKWSLVELHTRFNQIKDLNDIEGIFKTPKKQKTTREEEDTVEKGILKTYKKRKTTGEEGDPLDKEKEKEDDEGQKGEAEEAGKEPLAIQDLLVKSMTDQINYRQQEDPSFVCPEKLQLWKDEKNEDSEKKMKDLWDIFIQAEKRSKELEVELATYIEKLDNEECVTATMTVESTIQLNEIQNLKRRIAELEEKEEEKKEEEKQQEEREEENKEQEKQQEEREEEKKQDAPTPAVPSRVQRLKNRERKRLQASCYVYEKNKKTKKEAKKDDEELPQFKLISSEECVICFTETETAMQFPVPAMQCVICFTETETAMQFPVPAMQFPVPAMQFPVPAMQCLTQEASQPDATNPIPDPPKGTSLHDSIPVGLEQSSDEDEGQKKPTKKKLGWGQRKVWQKIPKADRERIEKHYLSTQPRDIFWAGLNSEKVTNHDLKDIVWDLELSQNVIEAYIQIEEDKIDPMQTGSPQYMSTWTWVNIVEGWLEYIRPQARVFIETKKKPTIVKQKDGPPTLVQKDLTPTEELTLKWIMQNPLQFPFEDDMECAQQTVSS
ncbi:hypothetical protein L3X38_031008 [Prunus dulcis]|uniref:Aminotransferase-like plant mobile domain-containing protein n=1 Tax=Prunus dulcis TaxID=3755 RepID=A0AAD4YUL9_PRUDU|nr:hypothetical protein L3X38_031008 [Prunus dulcis]